MVLCPCRKLILANDFGPDKGLKSLKQYLALCLSFPCENNLTNEVRNKETNK